MEEKLADLERRLAYHEEINRMTVDCLEMAAAFGDFQRNISGLDAPLRVIEEAIARLGRLAEFEAAAVFLASETSGDFKLAYCDPLELGQNIEQDLDLLIDTGMMAQALREKRPLIVPTRDYSRMMLAHALSTATRTRGLFLGYLRKDSENIPDAWLKLITIIMQHWAGALESLELSQLIREHNQELSRKVEEKTSALSHSLKRLKNEASERERAWRFLREVTSEIPGVVYQFCVDTGNKTRFTFVSDGVVNLHGCTPESLLADGSHFLDAVWPDDAQMVRESAIKSIKNAENWECTYRVSTPSGELRWVKASAKVRANESGGYTYNGVLTDTTELKQAKQDLEYLALHDALTGLPNRTLFLDRFEQALANARRNASKTALLYIDLNHFKKINDEFGHQTGDEVLRQASGRMRSLLRESDTVARVGGDEFVVMLPGIDTRADADLVAAKLVEEFGKPFTANGNTCVCGASVGVSLYPDDGDEVDGLIRKADENMYNAKNLYRG